jgi:hypothetical protein
MVDFSFLLPVLEAITIVLNFLSAVNDCRPLLRKLKGFRPRAFRNRRR